MAQLNSPGFSDWTASSASPMLGEKPKFSANVYETYDESHAQHVERRHHRHHFALRTVKSIQYWENLISYTISLISVGLTAYMEGMMVYMLYKFYTTRNIPAPEANRVSPWAKNTQLWPAFLLLISAFITFLIDAISLIAACFSRKSSGALAVESVFSKIGYVVFVVKWITVFILYRVGKTSKDLWGWSCDERAKKIQKYYEGELNFDRMCTEQTIAWYLSISEMAIKVILMVSAFFISRKLKKLTRQRHSGTE